MSHPYSQPFPNPYGTPPRVNTELVEVFRRGYHDNTLSAITIFRTPSRDLLQVTETDDRYHVDALTEHGWARMISLHGDEVASRHHAAETWMEIVNG